MISDTADVKPDETGPETKSIRNPRPNRPISISTMPHIKQSRTDFCHEPWATWNVRRATMAEGPTGTSLQLPRKM